MKNRFHRRVARLEGPKPAGECGACAARMYVRFDERDAELNPDFRCPRCGKKPAQEFKLVTGVDPAWI